jgi:hypothetical protein
MLRSMNIIFTLAVLTFGCAITSRHTEFTVENTKRIERGMTVTQIEDTFGKPDRVEMLMCGKEQTFPCMIYVYDMGYKGRYRGIMNHNRLYFTKESLGYWWLYQWDFAYVSPQ